ncbi:MAG: bacteriohemerythrin [Nitrospinales bacterium]
MWQKEMSVGNPIIDNDHKYLLSIVNVIENALNCGEPVPVLLEYVSQLINYSYKHFEREEGYQAEIEFPFREAHKKEHQELMEQITHIHETLQSHSESEMYQFTTPRLVNLLKDWIINHFIHEDMKMKEHFNALD